MKARTLVPTGTRIVFVLRDGDGGPVVARWECGNFMTELGEAHIAARLCASPPTNISHMAIGTGTGKVPADQTLATEVGRVALESGYPDQGAGADDNEVTYYAIFPAGTGTGTITEFALLNAASGGLMLNYATGFAAQEKGVGQSLEVTAYVRIGVT